MSKPGADAEPGVVPGGWIRPVLPLAVICCLAELSYAVVNVLAIPAYISKGVGLGAHVGTIMSAFLLAEALGRPGLGTLSDLFGRKPLMVAGPLMSGAASLLILTTVNPFLLVLVRIFDGLGAAAFWPAIFAAVGDATPGRHRSSGMGMLNVSYMVGLAFGPLVGGWVNSLAGSPG
jgi:MFS family permease